MKTRPTSSHRDHVAEQLRTCLENMAAAGLTITYGELARLLELLPPNTLPRSYSVRREAGCQQWARLTARGASASSRTIRMEWRLDLSTQPS
jgi:hypothetical protein